MSEVLKNQDFLDMPTFSHYNGCEAGQMEIIEMPVLGRHFFQLKPVQDKTSDTNTFLLNQYAYFNFHNVSKYFSNA